MDARLPIVLAIPFALAACSGSPAKLQASAKSDGLEVFEQLIGQPANRDSIFRQGDDVTYLVLPTTEKPWLARFTASCNEAQAHGSMSYMTNKGMKPFTEKLDSNSLPLPQLQVLLHSEQLRQACTYRHAPDWRVLDLHEGQDQWVLDRNSAVQEEGLLKVWTGTRLAEFQPARQNFLIGQWQERLAIDCAQHTYRRLSQFSVNSQRAVHASNIEHGLTMVSVAQATAAQQRLIEAACQPPEAWGRLAIAPEHQPRPPHLDTPTAAPAVLTAIHDLNLPEPRLTLASLTYSYDALMFHRLKMSDVQRDDIFTRDPHSSQVLLQPLDSVLGTQLRLTFRGLIDLAKTSLDQETGKQQADSLNITGLAFKGDWQRLPEKTTVAYTLTQTTTSGPYSFTTDCAIGAARPASQVNPQLQGKAKPVTCRRFKTGPAASYERFDYLEDYGLFVRAQDDGPMGLWSWRVQAVR